MTMKNSKLLLALKTLDASEWRAFEDFVASPFFNKKEALVRLCNYLKKQAARGFPIKKMQRQLVFNHLYPNEPYNEKQLNYDMSLLLQLAERFLRLRHFEGKSSLPDYHLLSAYIERGLDKNYEYAFQRAAQQLESTNYKNDDYFLAKYLLAEVADAHFSLKNERRFDPALQTAADNLDLFYLSRKLRLLCNMLDRQKFITADYKLHLFEEINSYLQKQSFHDIPAIALYQELLFMLTAPNAHLHFQQFREMLQSQTSLLPAGEIQALYRFAINFCIQQIRFGAKQYATELMALYKEGIDNQALLEDGKISPWTFKNMVKLGLGLRQFDWVEALVRHYSSKLETDKRADAYHFNLADLHYHRKEYPLALHHLNQVEFSDIHYHLGAKVMLLKIYFETKETEAFISLISTFRVFLQRNKQVPKEVKTPYLNFVNLLHLLSKTNHKNKEALREKISSMDMLTDRSWLLQWLEP